MEIRLAAMDDLAAVTALEAVCFPPAEAAQEDSLRARLAAYPNHFWLLEDEGTAGELRQRPCHRCVRSDG